MKIIQFYKSESGDIALDDNGNIYRVFTILGEEDRGVIPFKNELEFIRIKQIYEDRIIE